MRRRLTCPINKRQIKFGKLPNRQRLSMDNPTLSMTVTTNRALTFEERRVLRLLGSNTYDHAPMGLID